MLLSEISTGRNNNLNFIRFVAACMVIFAHSYSLSGGTLDPLNRLTGLQTDFGNLAVCIFFFFSGFLINRNVHKGQGGYAFFKARCVRIFPALAAVVILCAFVLGSCTTTYSIKEYFTSTETYQYLLNIIFIKKDSLPGVFEANVFANSVNGALWTLKVEFLCYIVCYLLWKTGLSEEKWMQSLIIPFLIAYFMVCYKVFSGESPWLAAWRACGMFYCGMIYDTFRKSIRMETSLLLLSAGGIILSTALGFYDVGLLIFMPYVLTYLAFGTKRKWDKFGAKREISYGIYLCAFPIQQTIIMLFGGSMAPYLNFLLTLPFALTGGLLLNIFVEEPLMRKMRS